MGGMADQVGHGMVPSSSAFPSPASARRIWPSSAYCLRRVAAMKTGADGRYAHRGWTVPSSITPWERGTR
jgi:hypothetical protein